MKNTIEIKNFRSFQSLKVDGFKKVNLIGGKNNIGKTSLLEALLLFFYPHPNSTLGIKKARKQSSDSLKKQPKEAWNSLFYNQDITKKICLQGEFDSQCKKIKLLVAQSLKSEIFNEDENIKDLLGIISEDNSSISILQIQQQINTEEIIKKNLVAHSRGFYSPDFPDEIDIPVIPSSVPISGQEIAKKYDRVKYEGKSDDFLKMIQILDPSIVEAETYSFVEPTLFLRKDNQKRGFPISLFGDATYRCSSIALEILSEDNKVIFVDEIENGIHHTNQKEFWELLFRLSKEFDVTIFATTHSLEMIKAFALAGKKYSEQGAYIELAENPRTQKTIAITRSIDDLQYELEHHKPVRGE
ncbi:hypothetical protein AWQ21_07765 [Picosynechococcus sp. PCC 7003]|uniref:AAA family ATPase n=1 Tax=Picosynechococcus sp. PCC 7003 TaxID=374981 RepID=UPI000810B610|nr:AAA family ATPase [Picosynechococcus sp. PCC 7003]ANV84288.1 hypothetical protein AWQ21_07765 [Picosynechococcus sp. PCC 7003]